MKQSLITALACASVIASAMLRAQNAAMPPGPPTHTAPLPAPPTPTPMGYGPHGKPLAEEKAGRLPAMDAPIPPGFRGAGATISLPEP